MRLYRVFDWDGSRLDSHAGGPLYAPRDKQGKSRHDIPHLTGVYYTSLTPLSPLVETIKVFRGQTLTDRFFIIRKELHKALVSLELKEKVLLANLGDAVFLVKRNLSLAESASRDRQQTQKIAEQLYKEGFAGIRWPSTLNSAWTNVSLFADRCQRFLSVTETPVKLSTDMPELREVAHLLGVRIGKPRS